MKPSDLKLDQHNANKHSEYGSRLLENSTRENGLGRSILISNDNVVIAGNGLTETAVAIGIDKVKVVETDGTEIVAVKRTDIKSGTPEFFKMALADNIVAQKNIVMDVDVIEALVEQYPETKVWGSIVTDPPGQKQEVDSEAAGMVQMNFQLSGSQAAKVKKALKISKKLNEAKFQKAGNSSTNGNSLMFIVAEYLSKHK